MSHYKPYPAYKDSGVEWLGRVPEHWEVRKLKWLASLQSGDFITSESIEEEGAYPVYGGNGLRGYCTAFTHDGAYALVGRQGALCGNINYAEGKFWASEHAVVVSPYIPTAVRWLGELLRTMNLGQYSISSAQPGLAVERIIDLFLPIPPEGERQIIAAHVGSETARIDALIEKKTRFIELLREKRQALITHAVTKGLDPKARMKDSGVEWLGEVPEHWKLVPLKYVTPSLTVGIVVNPSDYVADEGLPFLYGGDIGEGVIFAETARRISPEHSQRNAKTRLNAGDLVTVRVGAPGVTAVVPPECEGGNCASVMLIRRGAFNSDWLCYTMNSRVVRYQVEVVQYGAAQEQFNISHAVDFLIPVPPLEEQAAIASALNQEGRRVDALLSKTERSIALLKERRSALITAAVTGQIDLREAV